MTDKAIRICGLFDKDGKIHQAGSIYDPKGLAPTLDTSGGGYREPIIIEYEEERTESEDVRRTNR